MRAMASWSSSVREKSHSSARSPGTGSGSALVGRRLCGRDRPGRERCDPRRELVDVAMKLGRRQRARLTHPQRSAVGASTSPQPEHHLERSGATDELRQPLRAAAAGDDAERDLRLTEHGAIDVGEAHVHRRHELAPTTSHPSLDHRDRRLRHRAEPIDHRVEEPKDSFGSLLSSRGKPRMRFTSACAMKKSSSADDSTSTFASASSSTRARGDRARASTGRSSRLIGGWSMTARTTPSVEVTCIVSKSSYAMAAS